MTDDATTETTPEEAEKRWNPATDPDGYTYDDVAPKDWYLDIMLNFVSGMTDEQEGGGVGLTVQSGGATVSGIAISRKEWIAKMVDLYGEAGAEETGGYIKQLFTEAHEQFQADNKRRSEADLPTMARGFLHMKDARILVGGPDGYVQVPLWRGKLSDITGWSMGSWNPKAERTE